MRSDTRMYGTLAVMLAVSVAVDGSL
jgi:hypothetical protein